jgi:hypothetical protein
MYTALNTPCVISDQRPDVKATADIGDESGCQAVPAASRVIG